MDTSQQRTVRCYFIKVNVLFTAEIFEYDLRRTLCDTDCLYAFVTEPNFIQIVELLHVPLQTMYKHRHKTNDEMANGEAIKALDKI